MKLSEQVKPISYLKAHTAEVIREVSDNHKAVIITQNGEAKAIVQDLDSYEKTKESLALLKIIAQGKQEIESGEFEPITKAFKSIRKSIKEY